MNRKQLYTIDESGSITHKVCTRCMMMKPVKEYCKNSSASGLRSLCKMCEKDKRAESFEKNIKSNPPEKKCIKCGKNKVISEFTSGGYGKKSNTCKECNAARCKRFRIDHLDAERERDRNRQSKRNEYSRKYMRDHPDVRKHKQKMIDYRKRGFKSKHSLKDWNILLGLCDHRCVRCGRHESEVKMTRDHIIPVNMGGTNDINNIQPMCLSCNSKKGNRESIDRRPENAVRYFEGL